MTWLILQEFDVSWHKDIRPKKRSVCFDVSTSVRKAPVILFNCHGMGGNQRWKYNLVSLSNRNFSMRFDLIFSYRSGN